MGARASSHLSPRTTARLARKTICLKRRFPEHPCPQNSQGQPKEGARSSPIRRPSSAIQVPSTGVNPRKHVPARGSHGNPTVCCSQGPLSHIVQQAIPRKSQQAGRRWQADQCLISKNKLFQQACPAQRKHPRMCCMHGPHQDRRTPWPGSGSGYRNPGWDLVHACFQVKEVAHASAIADPLRPMQGSNAEMRYL